MKITVQQIDPAVLSVQGLQSLPEELLSEGRAAQFSHYCLLYAVDGIFEIHWEHKSLLIPENSAFLFFPTKEYTAQIVQAPLHLIDIRFDFSGKAVSGTALKKATKQLDDTIAFLDQTALNSPLVLRPSAQARKLLEAILWECQKNLLFSQEIVNLYMKAFLLEIFRDNMDPHNADSPNTAEKIMRYVHEHITEVLPNEAVAQALSYHPNYVNRVIKKSTGMTFHKYVVDEKLYYASTLLINTSKSITDIAYDLSFNTSSHFSNLFTEKYHCTPSQYRKKYR
ncbi:MAG: helix-turn-helix transcriptional regulator [Ruminococcaceae bacterium]|nr:helix-turn-helix transcriptional regulator [Oscillospiraceae bacterium]